MLFSLVVALMVLLVGAFWVYQGFFSALIMFFECVVAAMLAFGFYEQVHALWAGSLGPGVGLPLALMLVFLVSLVTMRIVTDRFIPHGIRLPLAVDRAGGGVAGFFAGMVLVGVALTALQMVPIGSAVFGFERLTTNPDGVVQSRSFWIKPDEFTVGLVGMLSDGRFGGDNPLGRAKPDLILSLYSQRASVQPGDRFDVPPGCVSVVAYWETMQIDQARHKVTLDKLEREFTTVEPSRPGHNFVVCNVRLDPTAAPEGVAEIRLRAPQFRIAGPPPSDAGDSRPPRLYLACGMSDLYIHKLHSLPELEEGQPRRLVLFAPQTDIIIGPVHTKAITERQGKGDNAPIRAYRFDVAFEVPADFTPWYLEFKHGARVEILPTMRLDQPPKYASRAFGPKPVVAAAEADREPTRPKEPSKPKVGPKQLGAVHVANAIEERTGVTAALPVVLSRKNPFVSRALEGGKVGECHFWVEVPEDPIDEKDRVTELVVPEGKKIVQIGAEKNEALSLYGRALNYASNVAAQIKITTADGQAYFAQGVYSACGDGGKMIFEIQYYPEADVPERCLKAPKRLTASKMRNAPPDERKFGYIFVVDPGIKIVGFSAGGKGGTQKLEIDVPE